MSFRVLNVEIRNILGVKHIDWDLEGSVMWIIGGENGEAKSSCLKAIAGTLIGPKQMDNAPSVWLKKDEKHGSVKMELSGSDVLMDDKGFTMEMIVKRKPGGGETVPKIILTDSSGEKAGNPREMFKDLFNYKALDPMAFTRMKPKERLETLRKLVGVDTTELDEEYKKKFTDRTAAGKEEKRLKAKLDLMEKPKGAPKELVDTKKLMEELEVARKHNADRSRIEIQASEFKERHAQHLDNITSLEREIEEIRARIEKENLAQKECLERANQLFKKFSEIDEIDTSKIESQIENASDLNQLYRDNEDYKSAKAEHKKAEEAWSKLDNRLEAIREEKQELIESAEFPVEGMEFDDNDIILNDLPFSQAQESMQIEASTRIGMALNPELKMLIIWDGSALGVKALERIEEIAKENDFLVLVEMVTRTKEDEYRCQVVMEGGVEKGSKEEETEDTEEAT